MFTLRREVYWWGLIVALTCVCHPLAASGARREAGSGLRLALVSAETSFRKASDLRLRLSLENTLDGCGPVLLDPLVVRVRTGNRPAILVTLQITDSAGREIQMADRAFADFGGIAPYEFVMLECGNFIGIEISNSGVGWSNWNYELPPGRYRAQAKAELRVRSFFERNPSLLDELVQLRRIRSATLPLILPDLTLQSAEVSFAIEP